MAVVPVPGSTDRINAVLEELFRAHGVEAVREGDVVRFPDHPQMWANGEAFDMGTLAGQLDVRLGIDADRMLCESVAGIGTTTEERINDGLMAFVKSSFHVLLSAFFGQPPDHGVEPEEWEIGGRKRVVFVGPASTRFGFPPGADGQPDLGFFPVFESLLKAQPLSPGTHWFRLYHLRHSGECLGNEALLDNEPCAAIQDGMAAFDWPASETAYDVRLFLVIRDPEPQFRCVGSDHSR